jgi:hypothetical protein
MTSRSEAGFVWMTGATGLEPATSGVTGRRESDPLSSEGGGRLCASTGNVDDLFAGTSVAGSGIGKS